MHLVGSRLSCLATYGFSHAHPFPFPTDICRRISGIGKGMDAFARPEGQVSSPPCNHVVGNFEVGLSVIANPQVDTDDIKGIFQLTCRCSSNRPRCGCPCNIPRDDAHHVLHCRPNISITSRASTAAKIFDLHCAKFEVAVVAFDVGLGTRRKRNVVQAKRREYVEDIADPRSSVFSPIFE